jgi:hypothetical protein
LIDRQWIEKSQLDDRDTCDLIGIGKPIVNERDSCRKIII